MADSLQKYDIHVIQEMAFVITVYADTEDRAKEKAEEHAKPHEDSAWAVNSTRSYIVKEEEVSEEMTERLKDNHARGWGHGVTSWADVERTQ